MSQHISFRTKQANNMFTKQKKPFPITLPIYYERKKNRILTKWKSKSSCQFSINKHFSCVLFITDKFTQFVNPEKVFLRFKSKIISVKMCFVSICIFQTIFFFAEKVVIKANVGANIPKQWMKKLCLNIKKEMKWLF